MVSGFPSRAENVWSEMRIFVADAVAFHYSVRGGEFDDFAFDVVYHDVFAVMLLSDFFSYLIRYRVTDDLMWNDI